MDVELALMQEATWAARAMIANDKKAEQDIRSLYARYRPRNGVSLHCPKCWMRESLQSTLRSVPGTNDYDMLRCNNDACAADIVVPI